MSESTKKVRDNKNFMLRVRIDNDTLNKLDACAKKKKITRSEIVRQGIEKVHEQIKK